MNNFEQILLNGRYPALKGSPPLEPQPLDSLTVGDQVIEFGELNKNGKITSLCRIASFTLPLTYSGQITIDDTLYAAFLVPEAGLAGFDLFHPVSPVYLLFAIVDNLLIWQDFKTQSVYVIKRTYKRP